VPSCAGYCLRVHGFQIWVNLPAKLKLTRPRYQDVPPIASRRRAPDMPPHAGEALGTKAVIETHTPIVFQNWILQPGADITVDISRDQQALREQVARYGPFVMNTEREIHEAIRDYQSGRMGEEER
jgi:redox-sensitive bicupin YhaK (pirin superfamily)